MPITQLVLEQATISGTSQMDTLGGNRTAITRFYLTHNSTQKFQSRPSAPHPLYLKFVEAVMIRSEAASVPRYPSGRCPRDSVILSGLHNATNGYVETFCF